MNTNNKNTNNNFDITNEDALNFITGLDYLADDLKQIDCPDFECNGYELLNNCILTQTLRSNIKPIVINDGDDSLSELDLAIGRVEDTIEELSQLLEAVLTKDTSEDDPYMQLYRTLGRVSCVLEYNEEFCR